MPISNDDIVKILQALGYKNVDEKGMCYGIAVMGIQAIFADDIAQFDRRFLLIEEQLGRAFNPTYIAGAIVNIEQKRINSIKSYRKKLESKLKLSVESDKEFYAFLKQNQNNPWVIEYKALCANVDDLLTPTQQALSDIHAFLDGVMRHHLPQLFPTLFDEKNRIYFQDAEFTLPQAMPIEFEQKNLFHTANLVSTEERIIKKINLSVGMYTLEELEKYFDLLNPDAPGFEFNFAILLTSSDHTIAVSYSSQHKFWLLIDANKLPTLKLNLVAELSAEVLNSFSKNENTVFSAELFCHKNQMEEIETWLARIRNDKPWKMLHQPKGKEDYYDSNEASLLYCAARQGDLEIVNQCLEAKNSTDLIKKVASNGFTPLMIASERGHLKVVESMLNHINSPEDAKPKIGKTPRYNPLYLAAEHGYIHIIRSILRNPYCKEQINQLSDTGFTPLYVAAEKGQTDVVKLLLEQSDPQVDPNLMLTNGYTALHVAAINGHQEVVKALLESKKPKVFPYMRSRLGFSPLYLATEFGHAETVKILLQYSVPKIDPNTPENGFTPLFIAVEDGRIEVVRALLESKDPKVCPDKNICQGLTPLYKAAEVGNTEMVKLLLEHADPNKIVNGTTALHVAIENGHLETVNVFLESKHPQINPCSIEGITPLDLAIKKGQVNIIMALIEHPQFILNDTDKAIVSEIKELKQQNDTSNAKEKEFAPLLQQAIIKKNSNATTTSLKSKFCLFDVPSNSNSNNSSLQSGSSGMGTEHRKRKREGGTKETTLINTRSTKRFFDKNQSKKIADKAKKISGPKNKAKKRIQGSTEFTSFNKRNRPS